MSYEFDFAWVPDTLPVFARAAALTVQILLWAAILSMVIGLITGQMLMSRHAWLRVPARVYVDFFRLTPVLFQIVAVFFLLPMLFAVQVPAFTSGVIALSLNYGAFFSEIFRAGVLSLDRGQWEAADAMGMTRLQTLRRVIYPQAIRRMLPPIGSMLIGLTKDTSLVSVIGVADLFNTAQTVGARTFRQIEVLLFISLFYLVINLPLAAYAERLNRRHNIHV
ncbi:glutamine ABC transporter permease [Sphaerisporangium krabiense]|uniref:His/Glu/Gln/Arg/opine family amino acid ABC transporter permease subunit n=1 Tax=Sphaerisporangium krabiense TaxID=763782 RepID=A0A7W8Z281_9ACTN|nr:amino acid ABC transporter permease [Sphaerisporangium krabiense]MBB5626084.1 His/Glu/Gln/Arg/opine family amino acid ABC transporter permease subunit [Sphaerisporangium krabiense]GII64888.1 glutamine ABC transporter permease [Sphaerisporangium krabiense]